MTVGFKAGGLSEKVCMKSLTSHYHSSSSSMFSTVKLSSTYVCIHREIFVVQLALSISMASFAGCTQLCKGLQNSCQTVKLYPKTNLARQQKADNTYTVLRYIEY